MPSRNSRRPDALDNRRRLYARINALPDSTVREELVAIAQRHDENTDPHTRRSR